MRSLLLIALCCLPLTAPADVFRPAYLELSQLDELRFRVLWKVPALGDGRQWAARLRLPEDSEFEDGPRRLSSDGAVTEISTVRFPGGLAGRTLSIEGPAVDATEVIARVVWLDGSTQTRRLPLARPTLQVEAPQGPGAVAWSYLLLGVEHILGGVDHLLFVLALLLLVTGWRRVIATVTAFTLAHSLTLVSAALGWMQVPGPPVEAIIALSIVFVAREIVQGRRGRSGLSERAPWLVAFSFGLLHGLGFAGALAEVGLPQAAIPLALLMFNLGVEIGQLLFVAAVLAVSGLLARLLPGHARDLLPGVTAYTIGGIAAFWTLQRVASF